ncbi:ATP-binding protein [Cohnella sp. GCM10027633]|uniref:ATP-binding protein n=1 Tax=unclassified Cohnella TaxID=2636738 RepID=UPI00363F3658
MFGVSYKQLLKGLGLTLCILLGWLAPILFLNENADARLMNLTEKGEWLVHVGDLAFDEAGQPMSDEADWQPLDDPGLASRMDEPGIYWLGIRVHSQEWRDPHLFVHDLKHYELYWGYERLFEFNFVDRKSWMLPYYEWNLVSLPFGYPNDPLLFRVYAEDGIIHPGVVHAGNASDFIVRILHRDGDKLLYTTIFSSIFVVAVLFYLNTKRRLYFYFGLLAFSAAYGSICRTFALGLFIDAPAAIYWHELMLPLGVYAFHGFFEQMFGLREVRGRRMMRYGMLLFTLVCFVASLVSFELYHALIYSVFPVMFIFMAVFSFIAMLRIYRGRKSTETFIMVFGYFSSTLTTLVSSLLLLYPRLREVLSEQAPWLSPYVREDQLPLFVGIFIFLCCMATIVMLRENEVHRQVNAYASELVEKNRQLEAIDKLKDEFLANTSHELRTPLNGIIGITESLLDGVGGPLNELTRSNLSMVVASGKRLSSLINDILDFSKLKHAGMTLHIQGVDMKRTAEFVANVLQPIALMKDIQLVNRLDDGAPLVAADENRVMQILYNLVGNALKFTESGTVELSAHQDDGWLYVSITDTGIGIPADKLEAIFEPFEQGEGSAERLYEGAGLGLSITRKLLDLHGGSIGVQSTPGKGSTFTFTLPLYGEQEAADLPSGLVLERPHAPRQPIVWNAAHAAAADAASAFDSDGMDVDEEPKDPAIPLLLLVDDDPVNLQVLSNFLATEPCTIVRASNGQEAVRLFEQGMRPDLVLTDLMMPRMTGYDLCRYIRVTYHSNELPIILLTARNQIADLVEGFDAGANDYLIKPVEKRELLARIALHLTVAQLTRNLERKVAQRTKALEDANNQLQASLKDTAEALAEASVLEERNRIAFDIHNTVGHSLTASIAQMEAAKMLIARGRTDEAIPKLDTARELVSKGLNDIRGTVRMLKLESTEADLAGSLRGLIDETERTADVRIERRISPLPALSTAQKRALFHALLEGLTNGIRHGRCTKFRFDLSVRDGQLEFRLANDGRRYEPTVFGFGLSAMRENIARLGGALTISSPEVDGTLLAIDLPLDWRAQNRFLEKAE